MSELLPVAWRVEWKDGIVHLFERKPESQAGKGNCISVTPLHTSPRVVDDELAKDAERYRLMMSPEYMNNNREILDRVNFRVEDGGSWTSKETWDSVIDELLEKAALGEGK